MSTRRQHVRDMAYVDIKRAARDLLINEGLHAVTINAVAKRLGMSGPAIYRYYDSHNALLAAITADFYVEVTAAIAETRAAGKVNLLPMSRRLRKWALANPAEFSMIFGSPPLPADDGQGEREDQRAAHAFGRIFLDEVESIWAAQPFPVPTSGSLDPKLRSQLQDYSIRTSERLPIGALHVFLQCWISLYGFLVIEVLHQIDFAIQDATCLFEDCLRQLCRILQIEYLIEENTGKL